jgi:hypothetical protein
MSMRRLCLTLLVALVAVPAALAAPRATDDGVLELRAVYGNALVIGSRGILFGQMDSGKLIVTDPVFGDGAIFVSGAERTRPGINDNVTIYSGKNIHFRVTGGRYRLQFVKGSGIDFTAVGIGQALLTGDLTADDTGQYAIDGGKWIDVPWFQRSVVFPELPDPTAP